MADRPVHKRSKSARVLNLLRSDDPARDSGSDTESPATATSSTGPFSATTSNTQLTPVDAPRLAPLSPSITRTSAMDPSDISTGSPDVSPKVPSGIAAGNSVSIEDSVRTFRVFEVLRGKDTAAISKAISESIPSSSNPQPIPGTTILHLAVQCAEPNVVDQVIREGNGLDVNAQDKEGNTALHLAAQLGRGPVVKNLLELPVINDSITNRQGKLAIDLARTPELFQQLQLARTIFLDEKTRAIQAALAQGDYKQIEALLVEPRVEGTLDVNALELATEPLTVQTGGTLLHEAARKRDLQLAQILLLHGADPFRRDRKGKLPQDVTKDDRTRAILKKSPAAAAAQRGIQEKAILGNTPAQARSAGPNDTSKDAREMKGYLKKWTNYTSGYKLRWFVLEEGVMSYYKHQDDAGSACRGAINMRIAKLHMDPQDKTRFEIHGKSSVKYHLKANHVVEAKRWFWALNNAIQYTKDEAREDEKRRTLDSDALRPHARVELADMLTPSTSRSKPTVGGTLGAPGASSKVSFRSDVEGGSAYDSYDASVAGEELQRVPTNGQMPIDADDDGDGDDASSHEVQQPGTKDAFNITAQSAKLQLELLSRISDGLVSRSSSLPDTTLSHPDVSQALSAYSTAVSSLNGLVTDLLKIAKDRDAYWQYRLERDADVRRMWEESMAKVAYEHEDLKKSIAESEDKRKRTKRALKEALEGQSLSASRPGSLVQQESTDQVQFGEAVADQTSLRPEAQATARDRSRRKSFTREGSRRKSIIAQYTNLSDSESGDDEEFFDAIDAGRVDVIEPPLASPPPVQVSSAHREEEAEPFSDRDERAQKQMQIVPSYAGYEDGIRKKLKMDADDRPKISLWGILKSMIGKDMTKMTLPVSFNEPTSLLQRVAEDMEYADLLDIAADRPDSTERLVYVAAFAASEYASTIGRVAKPFNPLLGETYEYVRPDKGYRFFIEQVSHHPPIGAAHAESARWDYWGESAVRSKFYGRSFDINPLGTWFLRLRPSSGAPPELYTWKKVTSSVVGIITGNPTVDNYGPMEIKNWTTGEVCVLDFKQRGWKASSAFQVFGKVVDAKGVTKWSIGGRWNDKIYARLTEGFEDEAVGEGKTKGQSGHQAFLVWEAHSRPTGIPFNLTPFVVTLNAVSDTLRPHLPPTDTRLRPDQRAMEDGEYDRAATEKNRVEEKQRAARRQRENAGEEWRPKWFEKKTDPVTGESYWEHNGQYWQKRREHDWNVCDDIY
ncbi:Oxysterol-binding protein-domain-containing protein [Exophiala viscosa]|uniref:Oxysterol-binding protein-domain-containing protein n=1 Tax=Exophiala viscosa TaxID=2486360 RepID=UPI00219034BE|nr:Oxysterol-binding protein-domain-containing protein [Exophiala viscosa]